jgi:malate permease and related proteins
VETPSFFSIFGTAGSVFIITFIGAILRRSRRLTDEVDRSLMWLVINLLMPALIINSILNNPALEDLENIFVSPLVGFGSVILGVVLSYLVYRYAGLNNKKEEKSFLLTSSLYNYGYLPIPLILALYDRETLGVLFMHNVGVDVAIWSVGIVIISSQLAIKDRLKRLLNPPLAAVVGSLFLTYFELDKHIPGFFYKTTSLLGQATIPVALLLVGSLMYDSMNSSSPMGKFKLIATSCGVRLVLFPICYLAIMWVLPVSQELKRVMLVESAQPAAMLPIVLAKQYGTSTQVAFLIILATSLGSLLTMPLWIHFGSMLIP